MAKNRKSKRRAQELISAPGSLTITADDVVTTLLVSAPTPADLMTMRRWVRARPSKADSQGLSSAELEGLSAEDRIVVLKEYARTAKGKRDLSPEELLDVLQSPEGCACMVWLAAKRHQPGLRLEDVQALVTAANVDQVLADFDEAAGVEDEEGEEGTIDPKADGPGSSSPTP